VCNINLKKNMMVQHIILQNMDLKNLVMCIGIKNIRLHKFFKNDFETFIII
jgi:hypothetical protein